ncbi:MAG: thioesterase family protein [Balneolaceae bacterium]|nr:thioesterase family protein [Balneolaceae bacterium]
MDPYRCSFEVIWADMDPNRHMRHSVYNDYAAQARVSMFADGGLPMDGIAEWGLGPILFREETRFLKEVHLSDTLTVTCAVKAMREDGSRWTIVHELFRSDGAKAATITVEGAWLDLQSRRLGTPPDEMLETLQQFPRTDDFDWLE